MASGQGVSIKIGGDAQGFERAADRGKRSLKDAAKASRDIQQNLDRAGRGVPQRMEQVNRSLVAGAKAQIVATASMLASQILQLVRGSIQAALGGTAQAGRDAASVESRLGALARGPVTGASGAGDLRRLLTGAAGSPLNLEQGTGVLESLAQGQPGLSLAAAGQGLSRATQAARGGLDPQGFALAYAALLESGVGEQEAANLAAALAAEAGDARAAAGQLRSALRAAGPGAAADIIAVIIGSQRAGGGADAAGLADAYRQAGRPRSFGEFALNELSRGDASASLLRSLGQAGQDLSGRLTGDVLAQEQIRTAADPVSAAALRARIAEAELQREQAVNAGLGLSREAGLAELRRQAQAELNDGTAGGAARGTARSILTQLDETFAGGAVSGAVTSGGQTAVTPGGSTSDAMLQEQRRTNGLLLRFIQQQENREGRGRSSARGDD